MAQNISLLGADYTAVPAVLLPKTGGGTARFDDATVTTAVAEDVASGKVFLASNGTITTGTASGGGGGLVQVAEYEPIVIKFADTDFNGWTPSTTAKAIVPTQTVGTFAATHVDEYDYFIRTKAFVDVQYIEGTATSKGKFDLTAVENWYSYTRRPSTYAQMNAGTKNSNVFETVSNLWVSKYYNTSWTLIYSGAYGIYPGNQAPSSSSTSAVSPTVTVKTPIINAKCNATYFSTAMAGKVDQNLSTITFKSYAYRAESGYMRLPIYDSIIDMWQNGL